ncbi:MAG TPA: hypothetical protein VF484_07945, partial [Candidatus Limnocylindrales bacterium]
SADLANLDAIAAFAEDRSLRFVGAPALRLRGLLRRDRADLEAALDRFRAMGAVPFEARVEAELGLLAGDSAAVEAAIGKLDALGDGLHARRLATEVRAGGWQAASGAAS